MMRRSGRRRFLARASALGAAALAACRGDTRQAERGERVPGTPARKEEHRAILHNADSPADTSLHHAMPTSSATDGAAAAARIPFRRFDPALPPVSPERVTRLHWSAMEVPVRVREDTVVAAWTFEGDIPGPIVHVRQGDTIEFTLTNRGSLPHSMDFHAAQVNPMTAFRSVAPGQSVSYTFRPRYAGAFLYHCGTAPVLMHLGSGMYGALIVDPPTPLRPAKEFVLIQSEYYLGTATNGVTSFSYPKMLETLPDMFSFNGRPGQYQAEPIRVKRGDVVRFHVVNAGPTHACDFHVVGDQFDTVYIAAPPGGALRGVQTFSVPAGGGMIYELHADIAGEFVFVNHSFGHGQKGAIGVLSVEE